MVLERVQKTIANAGYCSRRKAEELIEAGKVAVNDKIITIGDKADLDKDKIVVNGQEIKSKEKKYYLLNKPKSYLTTLSDPGQKRTIVELFYKNRIDERVIPVGRLDYYTEGCLLLTTDGDFANKVMHPRYEVQKTYEVELDQPLRGEHVEALQRGIIVLERKTWPAKIKILGNGKRLVQITIHEGRNKIVKRMFKKLGYHVDNLKRTAIGNLKLGDLKPGKIRPLSKKDLDLVFSKKSF